MSMQLQGHSHTVLCADVTGDPSGKIVSGAENGELCLWSLDGSNIHHQQYESKEDITSVVCSQRRHELVYTSMANRIIAFDTRQMNEPLFTFSFNEDEINQLVLNEKEDFLAACDDSGTVKVINLFDKRVYKTLKKHTNICSSISFRPKRPWDLYSGGYDSKFIQWDFSRGRNVCVIDMEDFISQNQLENAPSINPPFVHSISVSANGKYLACGTENTTIQVFKTHRRTPEFAGTLHGHTLGVSQVHFPSFTESHVVSGGNDGRIFLWNLSNLSSEEPASNGTQVNGYHDDESGAAHSPAVPTVRPFATINHDAKVNWITSGNRSNQKFLIVADNSENLTVYPYNVD